MPWTERCWSRARGTPLGSTLFRHLAVPSHLCPLVSQNCSSEPLGRLKAGATSRKDATDEVVEDQVSSIHLFDFLPHLAPRSGNALRSLVTSCSLSEELFHAQKRCPITVFFHANTELITTPSRSTRFEIEGIGDHIPLIKAMT